MNPTNENNGEFKRRTPENKHSGVNLNKDELYVIDGETLINTFQLLLNQRLAALMTLSNLHPSNASQFAEYTAVAKYINSVLHSISHVLPLQVVTDMQQEQLSLSKKKQTSKKVTAEDTSDIFGTLNLLLKKFNVGTGSSIDETLPSKESEDATPEE